MGTCLAVDDLEVPASAPPVCAAPASAPPVCAAPASAPPVCAAAEPNRKRARVRRVSQRCGSWSVAVRGVHPWTARRPRPCRPPSERPPVKRSSLPP
eukprot:7385693-Prymnesium_polylepis.1